MKQMESKICYARGGVQYFFTSLFGIMLIMQSTMPLWAHIEIEQNDCWILILIDFVFALFFIYFLLQCVFFRVTVLQNKIVYTNVFNRTRIYNVAEIRGIDPIGSKGMEIKLKGNRIFMYEFYKNYYDVRNDILYLMEN